MKPTALVPAPLPFPYAGPDELKAPILAALRRVVDPEVALSVVDIGLVYGIDVMRERMQVRMTMTSAACPVTDVIVEDVEIELHKIAPDGLAVAVELVWAPAWTADRMSPRARTLMGW